MFLLVFLPCLVRWRSQLMVFLADGARPLMLSLNGLRRHATKILTMGKFVTMAKGSD